MNFFPDLIEKVGLSIGEVRGFVYLDEAWRPLADSRGVTPGRCLTASTRPQA
jgi:hypothetical protein